MLRLLIHLAGLDDQANVWYLFWSGIGGDLAVAVTLAGSAWHIVRKGIHIHHHTSNDSSEIELTTPEDDY